MSDPTGWLQSTKKLCRVVIENREQQIPVPVTEEVTATYPQLYELIESIQVHHLKEDDVILIKGLQQHSEVPIDESQSSSEGVMCLSPSPKYSGSSVFSSLRKYSLGFQQAIHAITGGFPAVSVQSTEGPEHISTADVSPPDAITDQGINLTTPNTETSLHEVPVPVDEIQHLLTSEQMCHQNSVQSSSPFVQSAVCHPPEGIQSSCVATDVDVETTCHLPPPTGSQFLEKLSTFAEWMSDEILSSVNKVSLLQGTEPILLHMKQPKEWASSEDIYSPEMLSYDTVPDLHLKQTFTGVKESLKSSQDYLISKKSTESEGNPEELKCENRIAYLAGKEASNIIQKSFQEIGIERANPLDDPRMINVSSSEEPFAIMLPVVENYALALIQEVISESTKKASLERKMSSNSEPLEETNTISHHAHFEPPKPNLSEMQLSQLDIGTNEVDHLARTTIRSLCMGVSPVIATEQVECLTKAAQQSFDDLPSDRERHLSVSDKERADDQDYEELVFDKLGLTKKGSLEYPDAPPPTPLKPQLTGSQRSFTRKLKGGLAKEFLPSPPPPTPKETLNFCLPREGREENAEFMRKLIRSLSQECSRKDCAGTVEMPEQEKLQNVLQEFSASKSEETESLWINENKVQDYFSDLVSDIVFSSAQMISGIVREIIDPKSHNEENCHGDAFSNECQLNSKTLEKLNPCPSDVLFLDTKRIAGKPNGDEPQASFPCIMESKLWEYTDTLTQEIVSLVINFMNQIELLDYGEHKVEREGNGNEDCRPSCYIKHLNSMSEDLVKRVIQSTLHLYKIWYRLLPARAVSLSQDDDDPGPDSELLQNMSPAARRVEEKPFLTGVMEEQQFIRPSLETMKSEASDQAVALDDPELTGKGKMAGTPESTCGIGIINIASPQRTNNENASLLNSACPHKQPFVKVENDELAGENLNGFVQVDAEQSSSEQKEKSCQHQDLDEFLDINPKPVVNYYKTSSALELTKVVTKDPDYKPQNKTYAESLAETILNSSLADVCRHCSSGLEVPTHEMYRNAPSVSNNSQGLEIQNNIQIEEPFKDKGDHVPLILNTTFQGLNVIEYTGDSLIKQPQENADQSSISFMQCSKEEEGSEEMKDYSFLATKAIELLLVNFNSVSTTMDVQVQVMLQWATASQLNVSKIRIENSREDFEQFPILLTLAEEEEWTVGDLLCAVLAFCESNPTAGSSTLFDYLLELLHCGQSCVIRASWLPAHALSKDAPSVRYPELLEDHQLGERHTLDWPKPIALSANVGERIFPTDTFQAAGVHAEGHTKV
ncbi:uncharacterized protein [Narcine bancroftii]|uniref:uncharacterized protein n=1 Tax=Narcine bancroftii TaxID=1343680 RepID=UPI00383125C1